MITLIAAFCDVHQIGPEFAWPWYIATIVVDVLWLQGRIS
jgi:hypothetical protein